MPANCLPEAPPLIRTHSAIWRSSRRRLRRNCGGIVDIIIISNIKGGRSGGAGASGGDIGGLDYGIGGGRMSGAHVETALEIET